MGRSYYKSYGIMSARKYNITQDPLHLTEMGDLYLSDSLYYTLDEVYDYSLLKIASYTCGKNKWTLVATVGGTQTIYCSAGTLYNDYFEFAYNNTNYQCRTGQNVKISDQLTINCINVTKMKMIDDYLMQTPIDYGHIKLYSPEKPDDDNDNNKEDLKSTIKKLTWVVLIVSLAFFVCLIVIIILLISSADTVKG